MTLNAKQRDGIGHITRKALNVPVSSCIYYCQIMSEYANEYYNEKQTSGQVNISAFFINLSSLMC